MELEIDTPSILPTLISPDQDCHLNPNHALVVPWLRPIFTWHRYRKYFYRIMRILLILLVGARGFEPPTT